MYIYIYIKQNGLKITGSSVICFFCFRSSCHLGSLGGGTGTMAHYKAFNMLLPPTLLISSV